MLISSPPAEEVMYDTSIKPNVEAETTIVVSLMLIIRDNAWLGFVWKV